MKATRKNTQLNITPKIALIWRQARMVSGCSFIGGILERVGDRGCGENNGGRGNGGRRVGALRDWEILMEDEAMLGDVLVLGAFLGDIGHDPGE